MTVGRRAVSLWLGALLVACGAGLMLYRDAYWRQGVPAYRGFFVPYDSDRGATVRWARDYAKIELPDPARWRPLRVVLTLRTPPQAPATGVPLNISVGDVPLARLRVLPNSTHEVILDRKRGGQNRPTVAGQRIVELQLRSEFVDAEGRGVGVIDVATRPVLALRPVAASVARGALLGLVAWVIIAWPPLARGGKRIGRRRSSEAPRDGAFGERLLEVEPLRPGAPERWDPDANTRSASLAVARSAWRGPGRSLLSTLAVVAIVFAYFMTWATVKPPMQAPDEQSHYVKALSMPGTPWIAQRDAPAIPDSRFNPLCLVPHELLRLIGNANLFVSDADLAAIRGVGWSHSAGTTDQFTQAWSYPPTFYWIAFALGEGATVALRSRPYDSTFAWRLGVCFAAALLWAWVWRTYQLVDGDAGHRRWMLAFLLANPMLAFITSSVNPDALLLPLAMLAVLYSLLQVRDGGYGPPVFATTVAGCLVKVTGVFVIAALVVAVLVTWLFRRALPRDVVTWFRAAAAACLVAWLSFYAWSPPRLYGVPRGGQEVTVGAYFDHLSEYWEKHWTSYWGRLGWLDYQAPQFMYTALLWLFAAAAVVAVVRIRRWRLYGGLVPFAVVFGLCFIIATFIGEFVQVREIGYTFQGRYALPSSIGIGALVLASGALPRLAMLAMVVWLNAALFDTSVHRYWGDWSRYWRAQPFVSAHR